MLFVAIILAGLLACLIFTNLKPALVFICSVFLLYVAGSVTKDVILANAINQSVITLLLLLISSLVLERTTILQWVSAKVFRSNYNLTLLRLGALTAISSAFLNNTAVVATLMRSVIKNTDHAPRSLLIPLSYFAILGGTLTLIGTSTNLIVNGLLQSRALPSIDFFSFLPVGLALLFVGFIAIFITSRFLPSGVEKKRATEHYFIDAEVLPSSQLVGHTVRENGLRALDDLFLAEIIRNKKLISPVSPEMIIEANDKLIFTGDVTQIKKLSLLNGLQVFAAKDDLLNSNLTEVIVSSESVLVGSTLKSTQFRSRFDAAVVAINRQGQTLSGKLGEQKIYAGDKLILATGDDFSKRQNINRNFFVLSDKLAIEPLSKAQNSVAILGFFGAIIIASITPFLLIDTLTFFIVIAITTKLIDSTTIRHRFPFDLWIILICALTIANAFIDSGLANVLSEYLYQILGTSSPYAALVGLFVLTVILTETMTNSAAAAIMLPIGLGLASVYQVNIMPFVMAVAYAASASFISPFGYQTNLMVMNAGNYKVKDFMCVGWPITLLYSLTALICIPIIFPF
ncbi:SLC13 family permease [Pseudoalteromonas sp. TAE79]|uniref:SLC13 family permease n=1 Tax=Pseudoalteromonas sp. TAE79 TaxID=1938597 RepID=UPI000463FFDF|nr:SLC13 family permease [Pseudoalteromonas sp. TAE79]